ncbi:MAG: flagellar hook-basal body complex protein [Rhodospirillales bacterium]|nr:flagellar hook-basal body complex protein [Rhodospirillales bacterium]
MPVYGAFGSPFLGVNSPAHALNTIGINIANITTGGYKGTETRFSTVVSNTLHGQSDLGGVRPKDFQRIDQQGLLQSSASDLDVAIAGRGFFILNGAVDGTGDVLYP